MTCQPSRDSFESSDGQEEVSPMKPLNDQSTWKERECQTTLAKNNRTDSKLRSDVCQTTDSRAFEQMVEYIKSDAKVLDVHSQSNVASFYAGRSVFITGASGFVGKCLLEKLLRSCPSIKEVFILMRPKRGKDVGERVEALIRSELFDRLRNSTDGQEKLNKIRPIRGDIIKPLFGLTQEDIELLSSRVSLIIHSAATVKFVEPLKVAVENNVVSVSNLIDLASKFNKLEVLVHVSTAYSNCDRSVVDEVFYNSPIEPDKLIDMSQWMQPEMFEKIAPVLLGNRPNTYTYTKAVAESLLLERSKKLLPSIPIAMVRPSIVAGIWQQPICGWVDNFNGPTGVILSMMTGAIQAMVAQPTYCADIVPVDIVANLILCAAWQVFESTNQPLKLQTRMHQLQPQDEPGLVKGSKENENICIFNCVSGTLNPVLWSDLSKYIKQIGQVYPCNNLLRRPGTWLISNEHFYQVYNFINNTSIAYLGDFLMKLTGKQGKFVFIHDKMNKMINTLKPFTSSQWEFSCSNVTYLYEKLSPIDKEIFNFDVRQVRWDDYLRRYYIGSKLFAMKDDPKQVVKSRHKLKRIRLGGRVLQALLTAFIYYIFLSGSLIEEQAISALYKMLRNFFSAITHSSLPSAGSSSLLTADKTTS